MIKDGNSQPAGERMEEPETVKQLLGEIEKLASDPEANIFCSI